MNPSLPQYQCHKIVGAFCIESYKMTDVDHIVLYGLGREIAVTVERSWFNRFSPKLGMYFIEYSDGYFSVSPAEAFEAGYTLIPKTETPVEVPVQTIKISGLDKVITLP